VDLHARVWRQLAALRYPADLTPKQTIVTACGTFRLKEPTRATAPIGACSPVPAGAALK